MVRTTANDAKTGARSNSRPQKHTRNAQGKKTEIFDRFGVDFGTTLGAKIDPKSLQHFAQKSKPQNGAISWGHTPAHPKLGHQPAPHMPDQKSLFNSILEASGDFWSILSSILEASWDQK